MSTRGRSRNKIFVPKMFDTLRRFHELVSTCNVNDPNFGGVNDGSVCWWTGIHDEKVLTADEVKKYQACSGDKTTKFWQYEVPGPKGYVTTHNLELGKYKTCTGFS